MSEQSPSVAVVRACLRDGTGGSPTAVMDEAPLSDDQRRRVPVLLGTSHAVFVSVDDRDGEPAVSLRFFTAEGELPACGHGTVAALAYLAGRAEDREFRATLHTATRVFPGWSVREGTRIRAAFDPGPVELREPTAAECDLVLPALGLTSAALAPGIRVAAIGRQRLLIPLASPATLAALAPDFARLRDACDRLGFLGCYVHSVPTATGRVTARMFAPSIGVDEDIANANSTACLAAHLATRGIADIAVDMGDSLGSPSTITATTRDSPRTRIDLGGAAEVTHTIDYACLTGSPPEYRWRRGHRADGSGR